MRNPKLMILADDLTGGLDTGVQFAKRGISVQNIYKKTDSALRGNIGSELSAVLDAAGKGILPFIPAYPDMKRVTVGGYHYIENVPVAETSFGRAPLNPVTASYVPGIISSQTAVPVWSADSSCVSMKNGITVIDAETNSEIQRAGEKLREAGTLGDGPVPPDTVFSKARGGWYDIVVAMYHDQGHIPLKLIGFVYDEAKGKWQSVSGVNITLGLPVVRVSVDHGTAFDQAGTGRADPSSLRNAIEYAARLAVKRKAGRKDGD